MNKITFRLSVTLVFLSTLASGVSAGTDTANLDVSASVANSCEITGGTLAFGTYDTLTGAALDASGTISVACTEGATATITLGQGANANTGSTDAAPDRRLKDAGTNYLSYDLYQDSGRTTVWGNTAGTGKGYTAASNGTVSQTVYGRIEASQSEPAGSYTDTVVATITF